MNQVKAGAVLNYVIIGLNILTGLLYTPYMLRCLGQNEYGLYSLVASVIAYLTLLDFGFGNAIVRYTAQFRAEGKQQQQWELFGMFVIVFSIIALLAFVGGLGLYYNVDRLFEHTMTANDISQARTMMLLLTFNLAFSFPLSIFGSIISAYENFVFQRLVGIARILLYTAVMMALLSVGYKAIALVVVQTVFSLLALIINYVYCRRRLKIHIVFRHFNFPLLKEIGTYSFWVFLNVIMDRIYWGTGQFVLGSICGTISVAIFSVAILFQQMYMTFSCAINGVLLPRITAMVTKHRSDKEVSDLFIRTGRLQCLIIAFILSGFTVFGQGFIHLWAGDGYSESYIITVIFFVALFIPLIQNTGIIILQARNQMRFRSLLYLGISVASLALQIVLARMCGAVGCAVAIGGALLIGQGLIMNIYYKRSQHIDISVFWSQIVRMMLIPVTLTIIGLFASRHIDFGRPLMLVAGIFMFSIAYIPLVWKFSMNEYERNLVIQLINRLLRR